MDRDILLRIPLSIVCKCNTNGQNSGGVCGGRGRGMHVSAALVREEAILITRSPNFYNVVPPSSTWQYFVLINSIHSCNLSFLRLPLILWTSYESRPLADGVEKRTDATRKCHFSRVLGLRRRGGFVRPKKGIFWRQQMADH